MESDEVSSHFSSFSSLMCCLGSEESLSLVFVNAFEKTLKSERERGKRKEKKMKMKRKRIKIKKKKKKEKRTSLLSWIPLAFTFSLHIALSVTQELIQSESNS